MESILTTLLWFFFFLFLATQVFSIWVLLRRRNQSRLFDRTHAPLAKYPGISVITSLKGPTPSMAESLTSLLKQQYPGQVEFVIATKDEKEPLLKEARELFEKKFPQAQVKWVTPVATDGLNPRTAKIAKAYEAASHDWVFMTCVDTRFEPNYLRRALDLNRGETNSFVTGYPIIDKPRNFGAKLEAVGLNLDVMQFFMLSSISKKRPIGYGGALLFSKQLLAQSGGWEPILRLLTDDVTLARAFLKSGGKALLAPNPGYVRQENHSLESFWQRQVRWKMIAKYFLPELFFLAPLSWVPQVYFALGILLHSRAVFSLSLVCVLVRILAALLNQMFHGLPEWEWAHVWVQPFYDFSGVVSWVQAYRRKEIRWGSTIMELDEKGAVFRTKTF